MEYHWPRHLAHQSTFTITSRILRSAHTRAHESSRPIRHTRAFIQPKELDMASTHTFTASIRVMPVATVVQLTRLGSPVRCRSHSLPQQSVTLRVAQLSSHYLRIFLRLFFFFCYQRKQLECDCTAIPQTQASARLADVRLLLRIHSETALYGTMRAHTQVPMRWWSWVVRISAIRFVKLRQQCRKCILCLA